MLRVTPVTLSKRFLSGKMRQGLSHLIRTAEGTGHPSQCCTGNGRKLAFIQSRFAPETIQRVAFEELFPASRV
jgi:hypothetical protein